MKMESGLSLYDWLGKDCPLEVPVMIERKIPYMGEDENSFYMVRDALFGAIEHYKHLCDATDYVLQPNDDWLDADVYIWNYEGKEILISFLRDSGYLWVGALVKFVKGEENVK